MIRVLVADDEILVRDGLRSIAELSGDIEVVGEAGTGDSAVAAARNLDPDVVLMDIRMPGMDGIEATRQITSDPRAERTRVIVLTTFDHDEYVYAALKAGAVGFLLKDVRRGQLVAAIRDAHEGRIPLAPAVTRRLIERFCDTSPAITKTAHAKLAGLTDREREVFALLGRGLTNAEIAQRLVIAESTVKTHVTRVFGKLAIRDRTQAVIAAYELGAVRPADTPAD